MSRRMALLVVCLGIPCMRSAMWGLMVSTPEMPQHVVTISFSADVMQTNEARPDFGALENKFAPGRNNSNRATGRLLLQ